MQIVNVPCDQCTQEFCRYCVFGSNFTPKQQNYRLLGYCPVSVQNPHRLDCGFCNDCDE